MTPTIKGNIITFHNMSPMDMIMEVQRRNLTQYTGMGEDFSFPMRDQEHREFAGLIHRYNAEQNAKKKVDTKGGKPDNEPTPPQGGTPGAARQVAFTETIAIAA